MADEKARNEFEGSRATLMLAEHLSTHQAEHGMSQRQVANQLGYRSSVSLSHMALGRIPIPIDRAEEFAKYLGIDRDAFLIAVLEQRHPEIDFQSLFTGTVPSDDPQFRYALSLIKDFEAIARCPLNQIGEKRLRIIREVLADRIPDTRWMEIAEIPTVAKLRLMVPTFRKDGLSDDQTTDLESLIVKWVGEPENEPPEVGSW